MNKITLRVGQMVTFIVNGNELHYEVRCSDGSQGISYFLSITSGSSSNLAIFLELGMARVRHNFVKTIVSGDYDEKMNTDSVLFPYCKTLEALTKVTDALIDLCHRKEEKEEFDWSAFEETGAVETKPKVKVHATPRVRVILK